MGSKVIARKLFYTIILLIFCICLILLIYYGLLKQELRKNTTNTLKEISAQGVMLLRCDIENGLQLLSEAAPQADYSLGKSQTQQIKEQLDKIVDRYDYKMAGMIFPSGNVISTASTALNISDISFQYQPVLAGDTVISDRIEDWLDGEPIIIYAVPVYGETAVEAVLFATYAVHDFMELLSVETFNGEGYSYVVKQNGDIIVDSSHPKGLEFTNIFDTVIESDASNKEACAKMQADMAGGGSGDIEFFNEETKYMQYTPLDINDWYLLNIIPNQTIDHSTNLIMGYTYALCLIVIIVIITAIGLFLNSRKKDQTKYDHLLYVDPITGGNSYTKFVLTAGTNLYKEEHNLAFMVMDLMNMDLICERYGNEKGNEALRYFY